MEVASREERAGTGHSELPQLEVRSLVSFQQEERQGLRCGRQGAVWSFSAFLGPSLLSR